VADYTRTTKTVVHICYELRTPTNAVEVGKAISGALSDFEDYYKRAPAADELIVTVEDEMLVVWWTHS
jgi:hypothetical protein